jgi:REP element-mobilizing transposase RayT
MPRYRADEAQPYFCTITILDWLPVLIEARYIDPIIDSLRFCRERKGLSVFAFVIMPHHLHLIASAGENLHAVMRDFKRFTSRQIRDRLKEDGRVTILDWLEQAGQRARRFREEAGLWQDGFHPQAVWTRGVLEQKLRYLHENPIRKGLVQTPADWWYSSAGAYEGRDQTCMDVDFLDF